MAEPVFTRVIHPACVCEWRLAPDAEGFILTQPKRHCVLHHHLLGQDAASHHCVHCGLTSHHPEDVNNAYCGACHHFCNDVEEGADRG